MVLKAIGSKKGSKKPKGLNHEDGELKIDGTALAIRLFFGLLEHRSLEETGVFEGFEPGTMFPPSAIMEAIQLADLYDLPLFDNVVKGILLGLTGRDSYGALAAYSVAHRMHDLKLAKESLKMVTEKAWNPLLLESKIVESIGLLPWRSLVCAYTESKFVEGPLSCLNCYQRYERKIDGAYHWMGGNSGWIKISDSLLLE